MKIKLFEDFNNDISVEEMVNHIEKYLLEIDPNDYKFFYNIWYIDFEYNFNPYTGEKLKNKTFYNRITISNHKNKFGIRTMLVKTDVADLFSVDLRKAPKKFVEVVYDYLLKQIEPLTFDEYFSGKDMGLL